MMILDWFILRKIPEEVFTYKKKIMHITDTPDVTFGYIKRLIRLVEPDIIVHTGDLVDNIKLELSNRYIDIYEKRVQDLLKILNKGQPDRIYLCMGNHDNKTIVSKYVDEEIIVKDSMSFLVNGISYCIAHHETSCVDYQVDFFLFGHNPNVASDLKQKPIKLNGLEDVYIIDCDSSRVSAIPYPKDTDYFRMKKFSVGL